MILKAETPDGKDLETTPREGNLLEALFAMSEALAAADPARIAAAEEQLTAVADAGIRSADLRPPVTRKARTDIQALLQTPGANGSGPVIARVHELFEAAFSDNGAAPRSEVLGADDARVKGIGVELHRPGNDLLIAALTGDADSTGMKREDLLTYFQSRFGSDFHLAGTIAEAARMLALDPHFHRSDVSRWSHTIKEDLARFLEARTREAQARHRQDEVKNAAQRSFETFLKEHAILPAVLETLRTGNLKVLSKRFRYFAFFQGLETFDAEDSEKTQKLRAGDSLRYIRQIVADALHVAPNKVPRTVQELQSLKLSTSVLTLVAEKISEKLSETITILDGNGEEEEVEAGARLPLRLRKTWEYQHFLEALRVKREKFSDVANPTLQEKLNHPDAFLIDLVPGLADMRPAQGVEAIRKVIKDLGGDVTPPRKVVAKPKRATFHKGPRGSFERLESLKKSKET